MSSNPKHTSEGSSGESSSGEGYPGQKPTFGRRLQRNCSKWWWLYLLVLIIVVVLVVIPVIFVGIKKIAQDKMNSAVINVTNQRQSNPLPESFDLVINSTATTEGNTHGATVESFNASFYLLDTKPDIKPFIYVEFPELESAAVNPVDIGVEQQPIADMEQLIAYNKLVLTSEEFTIGLRGHTTIIIPQLPRYGVTYDNTVTMKGWNGLSGFNIHNLQIPFFPEFDGATMIGQVSIPNPSVISAQLGNVTMTLTTQDGTYLGYTLIEYVDLRPGDNTFNMRSYVNTSLAQQYLEDNVLDLQLTGNTSVNFIGQHLTYYEEALRSHTINYRLNLTEAQSNSTST